MIESQQSEELSEIQQKLQTNNEIPEIARTEVVNVVTKWLLQAIDSGDEKNINVNDIQGIRRELSQIYIDKNVAPAFSHSILQIANIIQSTMGNIYPDTNYMDMLSGPNVSTLFLTSTSSSVGEVSTKYSTEEQALHMQTISDIVNGMEGKVGSALSGKLLNSYTENDKKNSIHICN